MVCDRIIRLAARGPNVAFYQPHSSIHQSAHESLHQLILLFPLLVTKILHLNVLRLYKQRESQTDDLLLRLKKVNYFVSCTCVCLMGLFCPKPYRSDTVNRTVQPRIRHTARTEIKLTPDIKSVTTQVRSRTSCTHRELIDLVGYMCTGVLRYVILITLCI